MQSQPRNIPVSFERSRTDPSINTAPLCKCGGARTSRMTGVSPWSSNLGTRVWPRFPDPPVSSTFIVFPRLTAFPHAIGRPAGRTVYPHTIGEPCAPYPDRTQGDKNSRRTITAEDLICLGVTSIGHRRKLLAAIAALRDKPTDDNSTPVTVQGPAAAPDGLASSSAERRQLRVMFCDLVGSTELAGRLDPYSATRP